MVNLVSDIVILHVALGIDERFTEAADVVEDIAEKCNEKRMAAKRVQVKHMYACNSKGCH